MFRVRLDVGVPAPERIRVEGPALHHLRVARVGPGETVEVFDGRGRAWPARLERLALKHGKTVPELLELLEADEDVVESIRSDAYPPEVAELLLAYPDH